MEGWKVGNWLVLGGVENIVSRTLRGYPGVNRTGRMVGCFSWGWSCAGTEGMDLGCWRGEDCWREWAQTDMAKTKGAWFLLHFSELSGALSFTRALNFVRETNLNEVAVQQAIQNCTRRRGQQFDPMVAFLGFLACVWLFTHGARLTLTLEQVQGRRRQALQLEGPSIPLMRNFVLSERGEMGMEEAGAQVVAVGGEPSTPQRVAEDDESVQQATPVEGEGGEWQEVIRGSAGKRRRQERGAGGARAAFLMGQ